MSVEFKTVRGGLWQSPQVMRLLDRVISTISRPRARHVAEMI
jgi:hypothetical protein